MAKLEDTLELYLVKKAPFQLPENVKEALVNFSPWLALIAGILGIIAALEVFGLGSTFSFLSFYAGSQFAGSYFSTFFFATILLGVTGVLNLMAISGLRAKKMGGWRLVYYSELIWILSYILQLNFVNVILGGLIGLYFLFQIKNYYK